MNVYKLGCNWGPKAPSFYSLIKENNIVIGIPSYEYEIGDQVIIAEGFKVKAIAVVKSKSVSVTSRYDLKKPFSNFKIEYEEWVSFYECDLYELKEEEIFSYRIQKGIVKVRNNKVLEDVADRIQPRLIEKAKNDHSVKELTLQYLKSIPKDIWLLSQLESLDLSIKDKNSTLLSIPDDIASLTNLLKLRISGKIKSLPDNISELKKLKTLIIQRTLIKELPIEIYNLSSLNLLIIKDSKLLEINPNIQNLKNLVLINFSNNKLKKIPVEIANLPHLLILEFANNKIEYIPKEIFIHLKRIENKNSVSKSYINAKGNPIKSPPLELLNEGTDTIINYFKSLSKRRYSK